MKIQQYLYLFYTNEINFKKFKKGSTMFLANVFILIMFNL